MHAIREAIIISPHIVAAHQLASVIDRNGWQCSCFYRAPEIDAIRRQMPQMVIVDITRDHPAGLSLLHDLAGPQWHGYRVALCENDSTPMMRTARTLGVDGFFYLNRHGHAIDPHRGLAPIFLRQSTPTPRRIQSRRYPLAAARPVGV